MEIAFTSGPSAEAAIDATRLVSAIRPFGSVLVALSGGVDSAVVAKAAARALGARALAITGASPSVADGEVDVARQVAAAIGIRHEVLATDEFASADYVRNDGTRCYHCKSTLYDLLRRVADERGIAVVCSGANLDDLGDYRPGLQAAAERGVRHPLQETGLGKTAVRALARHWGLPNWDKPATPCLSSRLAVGVEVTPERTRRVDLAEQFLRELGFATVRVRYHPGDHARLEVDVDALPRLIDPAMRQQVAARLHELGFRFVSLDLDGFRSGSLNVLVPVELLSKRHVIE